MFLSQGGQLDQGALPGLQSDAVAHCSTDQSSAARELRHSQRVSQTAGGQGHLGVRGRLQAGKVQLPVPAHAE